MFAEPMSQIITQNEFWHFI